MNAIVGSLRVDLGWNAREFASGVVDTQRTLSGFAQEVARRFAEVEKTIKRVGVGLTAGITAPFAAMTVTSARGAGSFEAAMNRVEAALRGLSADQLAELGRMARTLGPEVGRSAVDAAAGIETLALTGMSADRILRGGLGATLKLSAANLGEVDDAAALVNDVLTQFARVTSDLPNIINLVTGALDTSKLSFGDYQQAVAQAGGVAGSAGVSFEDFNTAIAATSTLFASGSDAGTSFKTFITSLTPQSEDAARVMKQLGLSFFDATGRMKSMAEIAGELDEKLSGLSERSRTEALRTMFGTDAMRTAIGLMMEGKKGFEELQATISRTDAGEKLAIQMRGLEASANRLSSGFEGVKIALGEAGLLRVFTAVTDGLAGLARGFANLPSGFHTATIAVWGLAAAIGPLTLAVLGLARLALPLFIGRMGLVGIGLVAIINPIGALAALFVRLAVALTGATSALSLFATGLARVLGPLGLVVTLLGLLYFALRDNVAASNAARQASDALTNATTAYEEAAMAAAAATGEARREALAAAAAKREEARQVLAAARAHLAEAQARLNSARSLAILNAQRMKVAAQDPRMIPGAGPQIARPLVQQAEADAKSLEDTIKGAEASFRRADAVIAAAAAAGTGSRDMDFSKPDKEKKAKRDNAEDLARRREEIRLQQMLDVATARGDIEEQRRLEQLIALQRRQNEYEDAGLSKGVARAAAARDMADLQAARTTGLERENELEDMRTDLAAARVREDHIFVRQRENELFLAERIVFWQERELSLLEARAKAASELAQMEAARLEMRERSIAAAERERNIDLANLRADSRATIRKLERANELERRTREIAEREGIPEEDARDQARLQLEEEDRARLQGDFRTTFREGVKAALDGDLKGFIKNWWTERLSKSLEDALNSVADLLYKLFSNAFPQGKDGKGGIDFGALISAGASLFSSAKGGGPVGKAQAGAGGKDIGSGLPKFATGGSFTIGGQSGVDANLVQFWGTKGEVVDVRRPGDAGGRGVVTVVPSPFFDAVVDGRAAQVAAPIAGQAARTGSADARRRIYHRQSRVFP